jgi:signal transduction histidine kinase
LRIAPMAEKSRADLVQEIHALNERVREQDRQLTRLKGRPGGAQPPRKSQEKKRTAALPSPEFLKWLAGALAAVLPPRVGLIELDKAGRVRAVYGGSCEALEAAQETILGSLWKHWVAPEDRSRWQAYDKSLDKGQLETHLSFHIRTKSKEGHGVAFAYRVLDPEAATWILLQGQPEGAGEPASAAKHWAGIFAHELNQPLAAMLTTAQACRNLLGAGKFLPEEMTQGMDVLIRRVHHAAEVVRRLRILAGGEPPRRLAADLRDVVRRALDLLQGPLDESRTLVTLDFPGDFPAVRIDAVQIVQIVVNLVRNAIEAMCSLPAPQRQLTVRAQFDSREAILAVEDHGVGLSVDMIRRLFQPVASTKAAGMGLGLAVCRQIVEAHGGRIWARGNSPNGCVFSFSVPLETEEP